MKIYATSALKDLQEQALMDTKPVQIVVLGYGKHKKHVESLLSELMGHPVSLTVAAKFIVTLKQISSPTGKALLSMNAHKGVIISSSSYDGEVNLLAPEDDVQYMLKVKADFNHIKSVEVEMLADLLINLSVDNTSVNKAMSMLSQGHPFTVSKTSLAMHEDELKYWNAHPGIQFLVSKQTPVPYPFTIKTVVKEPIKDKPFNLKPPPWPFNTGPAKALKPTPKPTHLKLRVLQCEKCKGKAVALVRVLAGLSKAEATWRVEDGDWFLVEQKQLDMQKHYIQVMEKAGVRIDWAPY